ncbi:uncharacterized protein LOC121966126, partial [Plectropomus leopardus]|uniref:uncharacterized protein LOC121966126 n=1 Tax=Plectropomus leopardus TaxID=160734 RepID=UPI001C4D4601
MIDRVADSDTQDMVQNITETPQWLSKLQAGCAARKLFATLEKETPDFFKTKEGMEKIPPSLVPHLPPSKVKDLTEDVCPIFLIKMEEADLSLLPLRSPSRPALVERALLCLAQLQGTNVSGLAYEDVLLLGPLLCELQRSQLLLLAPDVLSSVLQDMAGCQYIPRGHRAEIIQLVKDTFGDPSVWTAETLEAVGLLLFYDDDAISALPNKPWVKDVLYDLRSGPHHDSVALRKKCFDLTTTDSNGDVKQPTVELIEELEMDNVFWTAEQLATMSPETFLAAVEILGDIYGWRADQLAVLIKKAIE